MSRQKVPCPDWARLWRVDEVIECLSFGDLRAQVQRELLAAMPDAYDNKRPPDRPNWQPGDDDARNELPPEPDLADIHGQSLRHAWKKISDAVKAAIVEAYNKHTGE